jgi:hypothetical protein
MAIGRSTRCARRAHTAAGETTTRPRVRTLCIRAHWALTPYRSGWYSSLLRSLVCRPMKLSINEDIGPTRPVGPRPGNETIADLLSTDSRASCEALLSLARVPALLTR